MTRKKILIADDNKDLVTVLEVRCRQLGLEVFVAGDAQTALDVTRDVVPDLVVLDVAMPCGSGLAACEMMSGDDTLASIPVVILTGSSDEMTIRRCHDALAYYVLKGPDTWSRLEPLIHELLDVGPLAGDCAVP